MNRFHSPFYPHQVIELVPKADGKGYKKPTMPDAIKHLLAVGVTSTLDVEKGDLTEWIKRQAIFHAAILPYSGKFDGETMDGYPDHRINRADYKEWEGEILGRMKDDLNVYADDGSEIDLELKNYWDGKPYRKAEVIMPLVEVMQARMKELGVVRLEHSRRIFSPTLWVTGEPDFAGYDADDNLTWVLDLKRKGKSTFDKGKKEGGLDVHHKMQVGAYSAILQTLEKHKDVKVDIVMSCRDDNRAQIVTISDTQRWQDAYYHQNRSWMLRKGFDNPAERFEKEKDTLKPMIDECLDQMKWRVA